MRAAIYARLSKDLSGISENVDIQVRETKAYARSMGYRIAGVFSDNDIGASTDSRKPRPGYQTLLAAIETNQAEAILVTEMARLYRKMEELLDVIQLAERTSFKHIIALDDSGYDLSTAEGINNATSAVSNAMLESRRSSDRMKRKLRARAERGTGHGGRRPYGYEPGWVALREHEADVVRWMVERVLGGETLNGLAKQLNELGIPTATGKQWHHTLVRQILTKPRIAGVRSHNGVTYQGAFPAIITVAQWGLLQLAMVRLRRTHSGGVQQGRKYLLTGLVYCGKCEQPMVGVLTRAFGKHTAGLAIAARSELASSRIGVATSPVWQSQLTFLSPNLCSLPWKRSISVDCSETQEKVPSRCLSNISGSSAASVTWSTTTPPVC